jgi:predicted transcriptional regulator YdeE
MDFGKLFLLKEEKQESLQHFIEAFLIYRTTFDEDTLQTGEAALYIANLLEEQKRFEEAFKYVEIAARNYEYAYETGNPKTIKVLWQKISISYALEKPETEA